MYVTVYVPKGATDPTVVVGMLTPPAEFPTLSDATYQKQSKTLAGGHRLYGFGLPVADPEGFLVPGEMVFIAGTKTSAGVDCEAPIHTCSSYTWFYNQNPIEVTEMAFPAGKALYGSIPTGRIYIFPVELV